MIESTKFGHGCGPTTMSDGPIAAIQCLALACGEDRGNSPDMAQRMAALMPKGRAAIVPGLRHMGLVEDPAAINAVLLPFLDEVLRPADA